MKHVNTNVSFRVFYFCYTRIINHMQFREAICYNGMEKIHIPQNYPATQNPTRLPEVYTVRVFFLTHIERTPCLPFQPLQMSPQIRQPITQAYFPSFSAQPEISFVPKYLVFKSLAYPRRRMEENFPQNARRKDVDREKQVVLDVTYRFYFIEVFTYRLCDPYHPFPRGWIS